MFVFTTLLIANTSLGQGCAQCKLENEQFADFEGIYIGMETNYLILFLFSVLVILAIDFFIIILETIILPLVFKKGDSPYF